MKKDVHDRLAALREAIEHARSMPMSASAVVNRAEILEMVDAVGEAFEHAFTEATEVVGDREAVVAAGQTEADDLLKRAQVESDRLVGESHVYQVAQSRAQEIEEAARREADELRAETEKYIEDKLANFELTLDRTLDVVRRGRARITGGHVHGLGDDSDVAGMHLPEHLDG